MESLISLKRLLIVKVLFCFVLFGRLAGFCKLLKNFSCFTFPQVSLCCLVLYISFLGLP
jgi:hypothetical protein